MANKYSELELVGVSRGDVDPRSLAIIHKYRGKRIVMSEEPFGPSSPGAAMLEMEKVYSVDYGRAQSDFRFPLTMESIARASIDSNEVENLLFNEVGYPIYLGRTLLFPSGGLVINPPIDRRGNYITDDRVEDHIRRAKNFEGVRIGRNGFVYISNFEEGITDLDKARSNRLVRALEGSKGLAQDLTCFFKKETYPLGVRISQFEEVNEPTLGLAGISTFGLGGDLGLDIFADTPEEGFVFGILKKEIN
jgi:hypothetical protein